MTATELKKRAIALAEKTKIDSVTPEEVGQLSNDIVEYIENVEINGSSLGIRKTYTSVSAMEADSTAPKDDKGVLLRRGMLVNIYNQSDQDSADNGKVFSFQNPGWAFRGTVDAGYATKEELTELDNKINLYFTYEEGVGVIGKDGEVLESFTSFHYKVTPIYYCKQGDVFRYKGNNADSAIACAFYYNNKFVSYLQTGNINEFTDIVIGEGINGVKFASFNSISKDVILEVKSSYFLARENSIEDLENNIAKNAQSINETKLYLENNRFPIILEIEKGIGFVDTSGNINPQESFSYKKTQKIPCKKGDVFLYKGHGETQGVSALFYP